jgi:hypothetical protein
VDADTSNNKTIVYFRSSDRDIANTFVEKIESKFPAVNVRMRSSKTENRKNGMKIKKSVLQRIIKEEIAKLNPVQKRLLKKRLTEEKQIIYISVEYPMKYYFEDSIDKDIEKFMKQKFGLRSDGSGSDFKWRDIGFPSKDLTIGPKVQAAVTKAFAQYKVRVRVSKPY